MDKTTLLIRSLHCQPYELTWEAMKDFTRTRDDNTADELWLLQHPPVFTQGQAGKPEHLLNPHDIPVVQTDRGGQITYHGPGQLMAYCLFNLKRRQLGPRQLVSHLEKTVIDYLSDNGITAEGNTEAHGVYVNQEKICSIGLRVSRGCSYHGIALNINVDLTPFQSINPCGFQGLIMTKLQNFTPSARVETTQTEIIPYFCSQFGYTNHQITDELPQALAQ